MNSTTTLTVIERASVALGSSKKAEELTALALQSKSITTITNKAGYDECHSARMALKNERVSIAKLGKDARDDATKFSKAVIEEEKRLIGIIEPEETRLQAIQDAHDAKIEAEKAAKAEAEANRIARIQQRIAEIISLPGLKAGMLSGYIDDAFVRLQEAEPEKWADEFLPMALDAKTRSLQALATMRDGAIAQEQAKAAEEARVKAEREELAKLRAEQEERNRQEALQRAEAEKVAKAQRESEEAAAKAVREAEAVKLAAERAEFERQNKIQADEREAEDSLIASFHANAKRIEGDTVPYIEKAIAYFESGAKDFDNDKRQRVIAAIAQAREYMQIRLAAAREAEDRRLSDARVRAEQQAEAKRLQDQRDELARQQEAIEAQRKASEPTPATTNTTAGLASASANEGTGETPALSQRETPQGAPMPIMETNVMASNYRSRIDDLLDCLLPNELQTVLEFVGKLVEKMEIAA